MDRDRYSFLAHASHDYCSPVDAAVMGAFYDRLDLRPGVRVLDVGCGKGTVLFDVARRVGGDLVGVGVDASRLFVQEARERALRDLPGVTFEFVCAPIVRWPRPPEPFDVVVVLGSTHAFGNFTNTLREARKLLAPGGRLLVGEPCWRKEPDPKYLAELGVRASDGRRFDTLRDELVAAGFTLLHAHEASVAEFDRYETDYAANIERFVAANPGDPEASWMRERARKWADLHQRLGRENMGFGVLAARAGG